MRGQSSYEGRLLTVSLRYKDTKKQAIGQVKAAVQAAGGSLKAACEALGISGPTLSRLRCQDKMLNNAVLAAQDAEGWKRRGIEVGSKRKGVRRPVIKPKKNRRAIPK